MSDPYKTLEVDPKASQEVIKAAYRTLAKMYRKDEIRLRLLNGAHEILGDEENRADYDREREESVRRGKVIGQYRIQGKIAQGGFGTTYEAEHRTTRCRVCIKHASHISASDEALLIEEARSVWDLRHWGIPVMRDILKMKDGSIALVMSFVPGPTLGQVLEKKAYRKGLDPEHVAWITDRLLNILKYLHFSGVVHGDVKPQNVIIQPNDHTAVLVDYGLSAVRPRRTDEAKGYTPHFAAPEEEGGGTILPETDFYSLGMTMIYALGGDVEFVKVPSNTPDRMCSFIKKLIRRDVLSRPNWEKEDLCQTFRKVREEDFGRSFSDMKPLKI